MLTVRGVFLSSSASRCLALDVALGRLSQHPAWSRVAVDSSGFAHPISMIIDRLLLPDGEEELFSRLMSR